MRLRSRASIEPRKNFPPHSVVRRKAGAVRSAPTRNFRRGTVLLTMSELVKTSSAQSLDALRGIVVEGNVRIGVNADGVCGVVPELYLEPANEVELARVLEYANREGMRVAPRGGSTKSDWGSAPTAIDLMISTSRFARI